jgi:hypothetical protein
MSGIFFSLLINLDSFSPLQIPKKNVVILEVVQYCYQLDLGKKIGIASISLYLKRLALIPLIGI